MKIPSWKVYLHMLTTALLWATLPVWIWGVFAYVGLRRWYAWSEQRIIELQKGR